MQFTDQASAAEPCEQDVLRRQFRQGVSKRGQGSLHVTIHSSSFRTPSRLTHQRGSPESWEGCLDVEPQQVVLGWSESADGRFGTDTAMGTVPIVAVQPERKLCATMI